MAAAADGPREAELQPASSLSHLSLHQDKLCSSSNSIFYAHTDLMRMTSHWVSNQQTEHLWKVLFCERKSLTVYSFSFRA